MQEKYRKILSMPRPVSETRPHMSLYDRAAQFSPFAALTGYGDMLDEADRTVQRRVTLSEEEQTQLGETLTRLASSPDVPLTVTYFVPDEKKDGGAYVTLTGAGKKVDVDTRLLWLSDGTRIPFDDIRFLDGEF